MQLGYRQGYTSNYRLTMRFTISPQVHRETVKAKGDLLLAIIDTRNGQTFARSYFRQRHQGTIMYGSRMMDLSNVPLFFHLHLAVD